MFDDLVTPFGRMGSSIRVPDTDVVERENEIQVVSELPGLKRDEIGGQGDNGGRVEASRQ